MSHLGPAALAALPVGNSVITLPALAITSPGPSRKPVSISHWNFRSRQQHQRGKGNHENATDKRQSRIAAAAVAAALAGGATLATAGPASAGGVTPAQLTAAGWTCIQPHLAPTLLLCAPPGVGLPPLPGTPGFADRQPSYHFLVFEFATGAFLGTDLLLRPDIYQQGTPPCPQQPGGQFLYNPRNDLWFCNRLGVDPSS